MWAYAWIKPWGNSLTSILARTRKDCIKAVEKELGWTWRQVYARGGRCIKVEVRPLSTSSGVES
jgi:hypothetical protein